MRAVRTLLDCDGVLGDLPSEIVRFCNLNRTIWQRWCGVYWTLADVTDHDILKSLGCQHLQCKVDRHMIDSDYCRHMPLYPGAQEFVEALQRKGEVVIVTARYRAVPNWAAAREAWLYEHFGIHHSNLIFAKRKELVRGDHLIDDYTENCKAFGHGAICLDRPWNQQFNGVRARDYAHVLDLL